MATFSVRMQEVDQLNELARLYGVSRNELLNLLSQKAIRDGFVPLKPGHGLKATSPTTSGILVLSYESGGIVTSGQNGLSGDEFQVYQEAVNLANSGNWVGARKALEDAGFTVEYVVKQEK